MMRNKKMKGQFFLLGAFIIITMFYIGLQFGKPFIYPETGDLGYIHENIETELSYALNLGINESRPIEVLSNFTRYLDESLYFLNFSTLWVVTDNVDFDQNLATYTLNVSIGNFLDYNVTVNVTANETSQDINVTFNETKSAEFEIANGTTPLTFNMTLIFDGTDTNMTNMILNKFNLYALIKLQRGTDFKKEELIEPYPANQSGANSGSGLGPIV
ncbi:MAG: hypothetical protein ABIF08_02295 [Nanoarchaeota archaeon]